jgi:ubiquinone/menaquinone biosynthesis C-methylase UbiE
MNASIARGYDRIAPIYDLWASLFSFDALHRSQCIALKSLDFKPQRVLLVGPGTGRIIPTLLHCAPDAEIVCVDISEGMLERLRKRLEKLDERAQAQVHIFVGDIREVILSGPFDLIVTPYFLDQFSDKTLPEVLDAVEHVSAQEVRWLDIDFAPIPKNQQYRYVVVWGLYKVFRKLCSIEAVELPNTHVHLHERGFKLERNKICGFGFLRWSYFLKQKALL